MHVVTINRVSKARTDLLVNAIMVLLSKAKSVSTSTNAKIEAHVVKMKSVKTQRARSPVHARLDTMLEKNRAIQLTFVVRDSTTVTIELYARILTTDLCVFAPKDLLVLMELSVLTLTNAKIQSMIALLINNV